MVQAAIQESIARSHWDIQKKANPTNSPTASNSISKTAEETAGTAVPSAPSSSSAANSDLLDAKAPSMKRRMRIENIVATSYSIDRELQFLMATPKSTKAKISTETGHSIASQPSLSNGLVNPATILDSTSSGSGSTITQKSLKLKTIEENEAPNHHNMIFSLGQLGVKWDELGFSARSTLFKSLEVTLKVMDEHGVVNALNGLANIGSKWTDLRADMRVAIYDSLLRISGDLGEQGVASIVLALAKLGVCWQVDLPDYIKACLRKAIARQTRLGEHALSSLLYGLGKLQRPWDDLHPEVRQTLKAAIVLCHINGQVTTKGVVISIYGKLEYYLSSAILQNLIYTTLYTII